MRIVIHDADAQAYQRLLQAAFPDAEVLTYESAGAAPADYLAVFRPPEALLAAQGPSLKAILNLGAGVDALLDSPALPKAVPVVKLRDAGMAPLMLDYVLYALLHFSRDFDRYARQSREARWQLHLPQSRAAWPVGVLGLGAIGAQVAQGLARHGFPVRAHSRSPKRLEGVECLHGDEGFDQLLARSRVLVNILPSTPATRGLLNRDTLSRLPQGAVLINPGRGTAVVLDELVELLDAGHLRGAALDVFPAEPLPPESPLWRHPKLLITPHAAAPTPVEEAARQLIDTIHAFERGEAPPSVDANAGY
ncbi:2-hydroxyacid dehydrogenase [Halotalea alkalilenta]|uniref:2-hydroxyacid dehydrogenase n=1 Tax=Halotalea alkalilenta TaxID=376489 RepID=UPI0004871B0A|nr:glyoxylate/hydroxypyruvate reductase A [Halotalea alkalilenta]